MLSVRDSFILITALFVSIYLSTRFYFYKNRDNYDPDFDKSIVFKNTGKKGSSLIFSPSLCFHKAGVPEKCRDMIQLVFAALPIDKKKLPNEEINIFDENNELISETKPFGFLKSMEFLIKNFKFKIA